MGESLDISDTAGFCPVYPREDVVWGSQRLGRLFPAIATGGGDSREPNKDGS